MSSLALPTTGFEFRLIANFGLPLAVNFSRKNEFVRKMKNLTSTTNIHFHVQMAKVAQRTNVSTVPGNNKCDT